MVTPSPPHTHTHTEVRHALSKLLEMTMEPKSAEIRRLSQKVITGFFDLTPATLTLLLRNLSKNLQESANRILKGYMNDMSSSSGEESDKETSPKRVRRRTGAATPTGLRVSLVSWQYIVDKVVILFICVCNLVVHQNISSSSFNKYMEYLLDSKLSHYFSKKNEIGIYCDKITDLIL